MAELSGRAREARRRAARIRQRQAQTPPILEGLGNSARQVGGGLLDMLQPSGEPRRSEFLAAEMGPEGIAGNMPQSQATTRDVLEGASFIPTGAGDAAELGLLGMNLTDPEFRSNLMDFGGEQGGLAESGFGQTVSSMLPPAAGLLGAIDQLNPEQIQTLGAALPILSGPMLRGGKELAEGITEESALRAPTITSAVTEVEPAEFVDDIPIPRLSDDSPRINPTNPTGVEKNVVFTPESSDVPVSLEVYDLSEGGRAARDQNTAWIGENFAGIQPGADEEEITSFMRDNLLHLWDNAFPEQVRDQAMGWYPGANNLSRRLSDESGIPVIGVAGAMAAMSPQKDWFMNAELTNRVVDMFTNRADEVMTRQLIGDYEQAVTRMIPSTRKTAETTILPAARLIRNRAFGELDPYEQAVFMRVYDTTRNPVGYPIISPSGEAMGLKLRADGEPAGLAWGSLREIGGAMSAIRNPSRATISDVVGSAHKVRNFYNNIIDPLNPLDVTIDTHAVGAALMRPLSSSPNDIRHATGMQRNLPVSAALSGAPGTANRRGPLGVTGLYPYFADAYRQAASARGVLPREMQSVTWEAVRGLFPNTIKKGPFKDVIEDTWRQVESGILTPGEARLMIENSANGYQLPDWAQ